MRNPYTGIPMTHPHALYRSRVDYGFLAVLVVGVLYVFAYVWPWWPWTPRLNNSGQAVGFLYFFLGGYAFLRSRAHRAHADGGANALVAWLLVPVALWDVASPFVLRDLHPVSIAGHVIGGLVALGASLFALRGARREPVARPTA